MLIRTRLSLQFSVIISVFFIVFGLTIYLLSASQRKQDFFERLQKRVEITEKVFLEKETFGEEEYKKIIDEFLHTLPQEVEEVIQLDSLSIPIFTNNYSADLIDQILMHNTIQFETNIFQGISKKFVVKKINYVVIVTAFDESGYQNLSHLKRRIILLITTCIPLIFIGFFFLTKSALLPLSKKIEKANSISASNLHQRLSIHNSNDEIGKMAVAFNQLLDRLELSFEAQKSFISNAAHEMKTPLTVIIGETEIALSKNRNTEDYLSALQIILSEAELLSSTFNNLLQLSKVSSSNQKSDFEILSMPKLVTEALESYAYVNPGNQIKFQDELNAKNEFFVLGNHHLVKIILMNIFENACKFSDNKIVQISLSKSENYVTTQIQDQGIGISEIDLYKIKTPFFRGNNTLKIRGTGLGLSICSKIIEMHNGHLLFQSQLDKGTTVKIQIPTHL